MSRKQRKRADKQAEVVTAAAAPQPQEGKSVPRKWLIALILGVTFLAFANTLSNGFAYDDTTQILQNQMIRDFSNVPLALTKELWFWRTLQDRDPNEQAGPTTAYYRPLFTIFHMVCWQLFTDDPVGWHLMNILVHMLAVFLAFLVIERLTGDARLATLAALLFAIHPLRSESVAWISGVSDPFLAVFLLASFYFYLRFRESGHKRTLLGSLALFLVAAFSKEPAVALPIMVFAYELFIRRESRWRSRLLPAGFYSLLFLLVSATYFAMRYNALGFILSDEKFVNHDSAQILWTIPLVIFKYLGLLVWPVWPFELTLFHGTPMVDSPLDLRFILPALGLIPLGLGAWLLRHSVAGRFAVLWFFIHLVPVLNLNAFSEDFLVQERYIYVPSVGFSLLVAMGLVKIPQFVSWLKQRFSGTALARFFSSSPGKALVSFFSYLSVITLITLYFRFLLPALNIPVTLTIAILSCIMIALIVRFRWARVSFIVLLLSGITLAQNKVWNNDQTLWVKAAARAEDQPMAHFILGHYMLKWQRPDKVVESLEKYVKMVPDNVVATSNLASAHLIMYERTLDRAHVDRAVALAEKGLALRKDNAPLLDTLGRAYTFDTEYRNYPRAITLFARAISLQPTNTIYSFHMGAAYIKAGNAENIKRGISILEPLTQRPPVYEDTYKFLSAAYEALSQYDQAVKYLDLYLRVAPDAADAPQQAQRLESLRAKLQEGERKS